jgi:hypothetical protein
MTIHTLEFKEIAVILHKGEVVKHFFKPPEVIKNIPESMLEELKRCVAQMFADELEESKTQEGYGVWITERVTVEMWPVN